MTSELYRKTAVGDALVNALDELIDQEKIHPDLALKVVEQVISVCACCVSALHSMLWCL